MKTIDGESLKEELAEEAIKSDKYIQKALRRVAWYCVQYAGKLQATGIKVVRKSDIDNFIDVELGIIEPTELKINPYKK